RLVKEKYKSKINTNLKNKSNITPKQKPLKECSHCGEKYISIDRKKNIGMCEKCWNLYKENKDEKYFSYINNFRLKRKSTRLEKIDKIVGDLNIF
ncbi:MAG: hypothetical protein ACOC2U_03535, partial [bacterium]